MDDLEDVRETLGVENLDVSMISQERDTQVAPRGVKVERVDNWYPPLILAYSEASPLVSTANSKTGVYIGEEEAGRKIGEGVVEVFGNPVVYMDDKILRTAPDHAEMTVGDGEDWNSGVEIRPPELIREDVRSLMSKKDVDLMENHSSDVGKPVIPAHSENEIFTVMTFQDRSTSFVSRYQTDEGAELVVDLKMYDGDLLAVYDQEQGFGIEYDGDVIYEEESGVPKDWKLEGDMAELEVSHSE